MGSCMEGLSSGVPLPEETNSEMKSLSIQLHHVFKAGRMLGPGKQLTKKLDEN